MMEPDGDPQAAFGDDELRACLRVLEAIRADRGVLARLSPAQRRELLTLAGLVAKPDRHDLRRMAKAFRRSDRETAQRQDRQALELAGLRQQRRSATYAPLWLPPPGAEAPAPSDAPRLNAARACYVCKQPYTEVHRYYDSMCRPCGDFNYAKREATADLSGTYALVTGARVKIGFQASLKLLRAGAHVVVTTRFPVDAAGRYGQESDYASFRDRLQVHGLDLRHTPSVELFARWLGERLPRLDFILNNACQTVRRPAGFFRHLLEREAAGSAALPAALRGPLADHDALCRSLLAAPGTTRALQEATDPATAVAVANARGYPEGLVHSAALSQRRYLDEDYLEGEALFPSGRYDEDLQQLDLRDTNSWRLRLHEVETPELLEVQLVNAIAPYILNARLKPLMLRSGARHMHIVNVSAMEGQFYRTTKTDKHPHTNMAKAALNMMTRTSAPDYVRDGIHMNAVDTGWVTDEDPAVHAARKAELGFAPPLDIIDGAARIVDPVFSGMNTGTHLWGQFLKDYKPAPW
ncbi:MAG: SDR family NAD(P)-dependent oxidoreductase [Steroidobacteraceae bacterium]|jgi:NAD(P)-dependent dehydrogenase (short-subunit alcohol dehydrogenase family)|nr:SDR family NAD(P)-dependent oxidoreductase [Steroidobacteraceae bacterium]